jgi:hypothetical protein
MIFKELRRRLNENETTWTEILANVRETAWALFGLVCFVGICWVGTRAPTQMPPIGDEDILRAAYGACQTFISYQVNTPRTLQFPWRFSNDVALQVSVNGTYEISGWFDSENDSGATVRQHHACSVRWLGMDLGWGLRSLEISPWVVPPGSTLDKLLLESVAQ